MDLDVVFRIVQLLLWIAVGLYTWISSRHRATREQVAALELKIARIEEHIHRPCPQVLKLEERVEHLPNAIAVAELSQAVAALTERIGAALSRLDRVDQYLTRKFG